MKSFTKVMWQLLGVCAFASHAGCSSPVDGAGVGDVGSGDAKHEGVAVQTAELKNGALFDASPVWNGAVRVDFWNASLQIWQTCSGQVVSGRTIMTAAHCMTLTGVAGNPSSTWVYVLRPAYGGPGWWTVLPVTWVPVKYNPAYNGIDSKNDVGLVFAPDGSMLENVFIGDALAISKTAPNNTPMNLVGYGYHDTNSFDGLGRSGPATPTYQTGTSIYTYGATQVGQPQPCEGDSGGPLKTTSLVYGVLSQRTGQAMGKCSPSGRWATTKDNMTWLKNNIRPYQSCTDTASQYRCW